MHLHLPINLFALLTFSLSSAALSSAALPNSHKTRFKLSSLRNTFPWSNPSKRSGDGINLNPNGSTFLWLPQDEYSGESFFDGWTFFAQPDPTNGHVNYVNETEAFRRNFTYVQSDGTVIMKADDVTSLPLNTFRDSVRISSQKQYNTSLMILDLNQAPWGCGVWPAFWTVGPDWPYNGEIDILEGVHDNQNNQIAWHTAPGCTLNTSTQFTGTVSSSGGLNFTDCNALINSNSGCSITEWSRASYGPYFDSQGGGVLAMKWDENSIQIWSFYRAAIPKDILEGTPSPANWGFPSAVLDSSNCDINKYFMNHNIVFDITFCGDWAGNTYATSGCPGTCEDRLMDPTNFQNASWSINSLKVYRKQLLTGHVISGSTSQFQPHMWYPLALALIGSLISLL